MAPFQSISNLSDFQYFTSQPENFTVVLFYASFSMNSVLARAWFHKMSLELDFETVNFLEVDCTQKTNNLKEIYKYSNVGKTRPTFQIYFNSELRKTVKTGREEELFDVLYDLMCENDRFMQAQEEEYQITVEA